MSFLSLVVLSTSVVIVVPGFIIVIAIVMGVSGSSATRVIPGLIVVFIIVVFVAREQPPAHSTKKREHRR